VDASVPVPHPLHMPTGSTSSRAARRTAPRTSPHLRLLLQEVEFSGRSSAAFWRMFWDAECYLSDADLERLTWAVGTGNTGPIRVATALRRGAFSHG
jgi:hypothetical protein